MCKNASQKKSSGVTKDVIIDVSFIRGGTITIVHYWWKVVFLRIDDLFTHRSEVILKFKIHKLVTKYK